MAAKQLPDVEMLRKLLDYDPETGALTWCERPVSLFSKERDATAWNAKWAGKAAFAYYWPRDGMRGRIFGRPYRAHRVIWKMVHGFEPDSIDHINGDPSDNRLCNLRSVAHTENMSNTRKRSDNTSGQTGVYWNGAVRKWQAYITRSQKMLYLGIFTEFESAVAARKAAEVEFGFHPNHGRSTKPDDR